MNTQYTKLSPNEKQRSAIEHPPGPLMILAGAGTGKTFTLENRIIYLIEHYQVDPEHILAITYTEKAKKEMYEAIKKNSHGTISNSIISRININTFHSFAYQYLLESGDISGDIIGNNISKEFPDRFQFCYHLFVLYL